MSTSLIETMLRATVEALKAQRDDLIADNRELTRALMAIEAGIDNPRDVAEAVLNTPTRKALYQ